MNLSLYSQQCLWFALAVGLVPASLFSSAEAGEWMSRLRDAHIQLRQALFDRNAEAAWEHVDRDTRQEAGLLAAQVRRNFDSLTEDKKQVLRNKLGVEKDEEIQTLQGKDLLVAKFFLDSHQYLLVGERDDTRLKDHGTRMAGPPAMVLHRGTAHELAIPYTFSVEDHFGGQAMDYRAHLFVPSLEDILGPAPGLRTPSPDEMASEAITVFKQAQHAFVSEDIETLWLLLDCDSQSQASHFADQARTRFARHPEVASRLEISDEELATLNGKKVWTLAWAKEDLAPFAGAAEPKYLDAAGYDKNLILTPTGYRARGKSPLFEPVIQFRADGRSWQIPVRLNYRSGVPELKLALRPPFYHRIREH